MSVIREFPLEEEYKKNTGVTPDDVQNMRRWVGTQPHLPGQYITDLELHLIYHCCNLSSAVSKQVLDLNYTLRSLFTNLFKDRIVDKRVTKTLNMLISHMLPVAAHDGSAVFHARLCDYDVKNFIFSDCIRVVLMIIDLWQYEAGTAPGFIIVIDLHGVTLSHLARLDIQTLQQLFYYLQEAMFVKLKGIHFLSAPSFMDKLMMLLKPFMKKELLDMVSIHQINSKTLEKFMPMDGLPVEKHDGKKQTLQQVKDETIARVEANKEFFLLENRKRVVESLRPGKPKTITDFFGGVEGSFKKLDID